MFLVILLSQARGRVTVAASRLSRQGHESGLLDDVLSTVQGVRKGTRGYLHVGAVFHQPSGDQLSGVSLLSHRIRLPPPPSNRCLRLARGQGRHGPLWKALGRLTLQSPTPLRPLSMDMNDPATLSPAIPQSRKPASSSERAARADSPPRPQETPCDTPPFPSSSPPLAENFLRQGITTLIASLHSGDQPWPLEEFASGLEMAPNVGFFAGHTWTRKQVLGMENRAPTAEELEEMKALVDRSMREGALGLSTGLLYVPANFAETEEVIELAKVAAAHGGIYVSHMRNEASGLLESVREVIRIAEEADIPAQINHHKAAGAAQWGWSEP